MVYKKRLDGRKYDELRPITAEVGMLKNADGSAVYQQGGTKMMAAVFGPKTLHPQRLRDAEKGVLRVYYRMFPFSVFDRKNPRPSRREIEISMVIRNALEPVIFLEEFANAAIDVYVYVMQGDAGTRTAAICAASLALADAGIPMKDLVSSTSAGLIDGQELLDLTYDEEAFDGEVSDIPIAYTELLEEVTLLQMDGRADQDKLIKALELGVKGCLDIKKILIQTLKKKYE